jgi:hypothetical protein
MRQRILVAGILAVACALGGCKKSAAPESGQAAPAPASGSMAAAPAPASGSMAAAPAAPANGSMAAAPVPAAPAPVAAAPVVPAAPEPPPTYTLPVGTRLHVRMGQDLSSKDSRAGQTFTGSLAQPVVLKGVTVLPRGQKVTGTVIDAKAMGKFKGEALLVIELNTVGKYDIETAQFERVEKGKGKRTAGFIGGGAGGGALIGGVAGGGKGALIGGLIGAGAGTAGTALTGNKEIVIPAETVIAFKLARPKTVVGKVPAPAPTPASTPGAASGQSP